MWGNKLKPGKKTATGGLIVMLSLPVVSHYEGLRTKAYLDPVGIKTVCYGETLNVQDKEYTKEECKDMLTMRLGYFAAGVSAMTNEKVNDYQKAAFSSLAYNIGLEAFKKSSVLRLANEGKHRESCDFMLKYVYAGKTVLSGLVKRRKAERELCLTGL